MDHGLVATPHDKGPVSSVDCIDSVTVFPFNRLGLSSVRFNRHDIRLSDSPPPPALLFRCHTSLGRFLGQSFPFGILLSCKDKRQGGNRLPHELCLHARLPGIAPSPSLVVVVGRTSGHAILVDRINLRDGCRYRPRNPAFHILHGVFVNLLPLFIQGVQLLQNMRGIKRDIHVFSQ